MRVSVGRLLCHGCVLYCGCVLSCFAFGFCGVVLMFGGVSVWGRLGYVLVSGWVFVCVDRWMCVWVAAVVSQYASVCVRLCVDAPPRVHLGGYCVCDRVCVSGYCVCEYVRARLRLCVCLCLWICVCSRVFLL